MTPVLYSCLVSAPFVHDENLKSVSSLREQANNETDLQKKIELLAQALSGAVFSNQPNRGFEIGSILDDIEEAYSAKLYEGRQLDVIVLEEKALGLMKRAASCVLGLLLNQTRGIFPILTAQINFTFLEEGAEDIFFQQMDSFIASPSFLDFINAENTVDKELLADMMTRLFQSYKNLGNEELYYSIDAYSKEELEDKNYRAKLLNLYRAIDHIYLPQKNNPTDKINRFYYNTILLKNFLEKPGAIDEAVKEHKQFFLNQDLSLDWKEKCLDLYFCTYIQHYDTMKEAEQTLDENILQSASQYAKECREVEAFIDLQRKEDRFDVVCRQERSVLRFQKLWVRTENLDYLVAAYECSKQIVSSVLEKKENWRACYSVTVICHIRILVILAQVDDRERFLQEIVRCLSSVDPLISAESYERKILADLLQNLYYTKND